MDSDFKLS